MSANAALSDSDKELETRFAHLLNPIRDLAKNWDVDIASLLENYLTELEAVTITFDGGKTTMNFVQAALLIQGSTSVYSRKVEFLYMLVQEMQQLLAKKKQLQQPSSVDSRDKDETAEKESVDDFLRLDDTPVNKNVDLRDGGNSKKKAILLPNTPTFFVPLDESEKGDMLFSTKGEQIGNKNDFKLGIGDLHSSGMLLLDVDSEFAAEHDGKITPTVPHEEPAIISDDDCGPPSPALSVHSFGGDNELPMQTNHSNQNENANLENRCESETIRYNLRARKQSDVLHDANRMDPTDPYEDLIFQHHPFRKGNVFRILDELEPKNTKKRKMRKTKQKLEEPLTQLSSFCSVEYFSDASKFVKDALKIPTFVELNRMYWQEQKERHKNFPNLDEILPADVIPTEGDDHSDTDQGICDDYLAGGDYGCEMEPSARPVDNKPSDIDKLVGCTYEDLVREHVEKFMSSAQKYVQVSDLAKRVQEWEERIVPLLEQEEVMEPFDIHQYGSKVLNRFSVNNRKQTLTFKKIVENEEKREVARFFLASLQLANSSNVAISKHGELESSINTMELTLLSRVRHHEQLDDYVAPSLQAS